MIPDSFSKNKSWRARLAHLVSLEDTPHRLALGLAIGIFLGVFPTFGLAIPLSVLLAGLFRANPVTAAAGCAIGLPWFAPFFWSASYLLGLFLLRIPLPKNLGAETLTWKRVLEEGLWPYLLGNILLSLLASILGYILLKLWLKRKHV